MINQKKLGTALTAVLAQAFHAATPGAYSRCGGDRLRIREEAKVRYQQDDQFAALVANAVGNIIGIVLQCDEGELNPMETHLEDAAEKEKEDALTSEDKRKRYEH